MHTARVRGVVSVTAALAGAAGMMTFVERTTHDPGDGVSAIDPSHRAVQDLLDGLDVVLLDP